MKTKSNLQKFLLQTFCGSLSLVALIGCATTNENTSAEIRRPKPRTYPELIAPKVNDEWNIEVKNQAERLKNETANVKDSKLTVGVIALVASDGTVQGVRVLKSSGVKTMDELAMVTFRRVSPLPRPPVRAVKNGSAQIPWDFNLEK